MYSITFLAVVSFLVSLLLTPFVRNRFNSWGIVDQPGTRKIHREAVPRVGGIAIAAAYLVSFGLLYLVRLNAGRFIWSGWQEIIRLLPAVAVIFIIGLYDDLFGMKPAYKLAGQIAAALLAVWGGVHVQSIGTHAFSHWFAVPLTVVWLVACTNALNLIDGMDGLAAGVGLFAASTTFVAALLQHNVVLCLATVPLACALLGFLRYNFNPATIFLGDSGSLLIGFMLGCYGVLWSQKAATILGMTAPLMALSVPLIDTALSIVRRFLRHQPIFSPDRGHIHHRLLDHGFSPRKAALVLYACCALGATASLLAMNQQFSGLVVITFCVIAWIGVQHLGYVEFGVARRMFVEGAFRRQINNQVLLQTFEKNLAAAATPDECWAIILAASADFGFYEIRVSLAGNVFQHRQAVVPNRFWHMKVPLSSSDFVELSRELGSDPRASSVAAFAEILRGALDQKFPPAEAPLASPAARAAHAR
jgi:UDP-GlcNAc:undecaprenyl-phosphate/decaprenyl-phosphate GlcNAc-1-phosphate transferase